MMAFFNAAASLVWCSLTALSRVLHACGARHSTKLPVRVIAVGNFEVGGTGKTPIVAQIAREAALRGHHPVILTRGYGGRWETGGGLIEPHGTDAPTPHPRDCGDEPALLHDLVPSAWIGVGANRVRSFELASARARELGLPPPDLAILDDGLQHLAIEHDVEVVLSTSARPWQKIFREFPVSRSKPSLHAWTKGGIPPFRSGVLQPLIRIRWRTELQSASGANRPLWLVTGVADSEQVRQSIEAAGWRVVAHSACRDHAKYSREWIDDLSVRAQSGGLLLATTGKDWVKWRAMGVDSEDVAVFEPGPLWDEEGRRSWMRVLWAE
jgi:tetraacyldisaccharide 4'-kinase